MTDYPIDAEGAYNNHLKQASNIHFNYLYPSIIFQQYHFKILNLSIRLRFK